MGIYLHFTENLSIQLITIIYIIGSISKSKKQQQKKNQKKI